MFTYWRTLGFSRNNVQYEFNVDEIRIPDKFLHEKNTVLTVYAIDDVVDVLRSFRRYVKPFEYSMELIWMMQGW